jgi:2-haloacid dehalogenase
VVDHSAIDASAMRAAPARPGEAGAGWTRPGDCATLPAGRSNDHMAHAVYAFDAYGTLFDVHSAVRRHAEALGPEAERLSQLWRAKQLEYAWVRSLMGRFVDFWTITEEALDHALAAVPSAEPSLKPALMRAYFELDAYPEVPLVLEALKRDDRRLAVLSNGSQAMLESAIKAAGLDGLFDTVLSVDQIRCYKTDERVYEMLTTEFRVYPEAVSYQSSNRWDIAGATAFGFRAVWINRTGAPDEYGDLAPAAVLPSLEGLAGL